MSVRSRDHHRPPITNPALFSSSSSSSSSHPVPFTNTSFISSPTIVPNSLKPSLPAQTKVFKMPGFSPTKRGLKRAFKYISSDVDPPSNPQVNVPTHDKIMTSEIPRKLDTDLVTMGKLHESGKARPKLSLDFSFLDNNNKEPEYELVPLDQLSGAQGMFG